MSDYDSSDTDSTLSVDSYSSDNEIIIEEYENNVGDIDKIKYIEITDAFINTPDEILIHLYQYQKRSLYKMINIENTGRIEDLTYISEKNYIRCLNIKPTSMNIITTIGIYSDELKIKIPMGKYKSNIELMDEKIIPINNILTIIALIKCNKIVNNNNNILKKAINGASMSTIANNTQLTQTLIIVEHSECDNIITQFEKYSPELKIYLISTQKHNDNIVIGSWYDDNEWSEDGIKIINKEEIILDEIKNYDVIVCSHMLYYRFYQSVIDYKWNRIVIIDPDKYYLPYEMVTSFNFMWFVISNPYKLYDDKPYISKIFGKLMDDKKLLVDYLIVKNKIDDIKNEMII